MFLNKCDDLDIRQDCLADYWKASQPILATAAVLIQQANEFFLKGKIFEKDPAAIIVTSEKQEKLKKFSEYKTISASELLKTYKRVLKKEPNKEFIQLYYRKRNIRNTISHSIDDTLVINFQQEVKDIFIIHKSMVGPKLWASSRLKYLEELPETKLKFKNDDSLLYPRELILMEEFSLAIDMLGKDFSKEYLNFNPENESFYCPKCLGEIMRYYYYDSKLMDEGYPSLQKNTDNLLECYLCGHIVRTPLLVCQNCLKEGFDVQYKACLHCC